MSRQERILIAEDFIEQDHSISSVLRVLKIPSSTYYYSSIANGKNRGAPKSSHTKTITGKIVSNKKVVEDIETLLKQEFVDYGYRKVRHWLKQNKGYLINEKKVYRLMAEHRLLNKKVQVKRSPRIWVTELVPKPTQVMEYLEFDIKYVYIAGKRRNAMVLTVLDVSSRWILGQYIDWRINEYNVRALFEKIFSQYDLPEKMYVRNDNGSQFVANLVRAYFAKKEVVQEFTRPATPEQNAHIESYHSLMERAVCRRYDFDTLEEMQLTFNRWVKFYNFERIHSGIQYLNPAKYLQNKGYDIQWNKELEITLDCRSESLNQFAI